MRTFWSTTFAVAGLTLSLAVPEAICRESAPAEFYPDVEPLLSSGTTVVDEPITYPDQAPAEVTAVIVTLQPGESAGWHRHGVPLFGLMLEGELTVQHIGHGRRSYRAGDSVLEAMQVTHNGTNTGSDVVRILVVFMGAEDLPNTLPIDTASNGEAVVALKDTVEARLALMVGAARHKWNKYLPVEDLEREAVVLEETVETATMEGVAEDSARTLIGVQIEAAKMIQQSLFSQWRRANAGKVEDAPDLKADIRPKILILTRELIANFKTAQDSLQRCSSQETLRSPSLTLFPLAEAWAVAVAGILSEFPACTG